MNATIEIDGKVIQHDASGVGSNWRKATDDTCPANVRMEIEGEIENGNEDCEDYTASNGLHYRW